MRVCVCDLCVAETDVISQRTSVSSVLKGKKDMQSATLGKVMMCACVCVCIYLCDFLREMSFYCFINLLLGARWTVSVCMCVCIDPIHACSGLLEITDKNEHVCI